MMMIFTKHGFAGVKETPCITYLPELHVYDLMSWHIVICSSDKQMQESKEAIRKACGKEHHFVTTDDMRDSKKDGEVQYFTAFVARSDIEGLLGDEMEIAKGDAFFDHGKCGFKRNFLNVEGAKK